MKIKIFLELFGEFVNTQIDNKNDNFENFLDAKPSEDEEARNKKLKNKLGGKDVIQLKTNFIPRDMIPLEKLFDQNDVAKDPKVKPVDNVVKDKNIGTEETPRIVKMSKNLPVNEKEKYINLMKNYTDVFA